MLVERIAKSEVSYLAPGVALAAEQDQPRAGRLHAELAHERDDLAAVIRGMIHGVTEHVPEGVAVLPARRRFDGDRVRELGLGEFPTEWHQIRHHFVPPRTHAHELD